MLAQPFRAAPDNAKTVKIPALGLELTVRLPAEVLNGAMTIMETINAAGFGPPLHRHHEAEVFRVMEGAYLFEVDGHRFRAEAGEVICVPGGAAHAFLNVSDHPSRQMVMILPGMDAENTFSWGWLKFWHRHTLIRLPSMLLACPGEWSSWVHRSPPRRKPPIWYPGQNVGTPRFGR
jgi:mannose-6-phosphate isomerase-like protein (cupin superfamily)